MTFMGYFAITYFGSMFLKIIGVPGFKDVGWGWFIIMPILVPVLRLMWYIITFVFYAALGFGVTYGLVKLIIWALSYT